MILRNRSCIALALVLFLTQGPACLVRAQTSEECLIAKTQCDRDLSSCQSACPYNIDGLADPGCIFGCYDIQLLCYAQNESIGLCPKTVDTAGICATAFTLAEFSDGLLSRSDFHALILASAVELCDNVPLFLVEYMFALLASDTACAPCQEAPGSRCCGQDLQIPLATMTEEDVTLICGFVDFIVQAECTKTNEFCIPEQVPSCVSTNEACAPDCAATNDPEATVSCLDTCLGPASFECFGICTGSATETAAGSNSNSGTTRHMFLAVECWVGAVLLLWTLV